MTASSQSRADACTPVSWLPRRVAPPTEVQPMGRRLNELTCAVEAMEPGDPDPDRHTGTDSISRLYETYSHGYENGERDGYTGGVRWGFACGAVAAIAVGAAVFVVFAGAGFASTMLK